MKKRIILSGFIFFFIFFPNLSSSQNDLQSKRYTFQLDRPYPVEKIIKQKKSIKPKNIILMIGDGMSLSIMYTAWTANHGHLNIDNCEYVGLSKTYSANQLITDSGAGATAFATGHKTNNHSIGVDVTGKAQESILEIAKAHQLSTGLIATCNILDATPSAFIAKINDRAEWDEIALQYVSSGVDFVCGGGLENFQRGKNGRDLIKELNNKGYQLPGTIEELDKINKGKVFALLADNNLPAPKKRNDALSKAANKSIELLSRNENGFFLMIEGSLMDGYAHKNNLELLMDETFDFDRTIGEVLKFAAKNGETLVVITADHETGGWTLLDGDINSGLVKGNFSTDGHTGVMVPVYSFGPKAETFSGIFENTDLFSKMIQAYGLNN